MNGAERSSGIMDALTTRERDVFTRLLQGKKEKDIALAPGIRRSAGKGLPQKIKSPQQAGSDCSVCGQFKSIIR